MTARRMLAAKMALAAAMAVLLAACSRDTGTRFQGWVEADLVFVGPDETGRVETLAVREGDTVTAGAPLFALDADLQKADLQAATASVAEAKARLARLEAAQQRKEEVAVLEAQEHRVEASLALTSAELERQLALSAKGITTQANLDTAKANANRDRAQLEEVRQQIAVARMAARDEDIAAARQALAAAEARRTSAETKLARRQVVSPAAGTVQQLYYRQGELVPAGRPIVSLLPPGNVKLRFFVPEALLPRVALGQAVRIACDGCAADLTAKISFIARTAEFTPPVIYSLEERSKLVFLVEARPETPDALRVGQPVTVTFAEPKS
jgi:HlyD family secretion protein